MNLKMNHTSVKEQRVKEKCVQVSLEELLALKMQANLFSHAKFYKKVLGGGKPSPRLLAQGMEFSESRNYYEGDDVRNIDWKVTARTGKAHTKLYTEEKENKVITLLDMRHPMYFGTRAVFKSVQGCLIAANVAWSSFNTGYNFSGFIFDDEILMQSEKSDPKSSTLLFLKNIAEKSLQTTISTTNPLMMQSEIMQFSLERIKKVAKPGSLIFVISDFRNTSSYSLSLLNELAKHSELFLCFLYDPFEKDLPKKKSLKISDGKIEKFFTTYSEKALESYRKNFALRRDPIASLAIKKNIYFFECSTDDDYQEKLKKYFN